MTDILPIIVVAAITGAGIVTGLLFAFSNFVMRALAELPSEQGMFAMQRINVTIINPIFMIFFLGTPVLCAVIVASTLFGSGVADHLFLLMGAIAYLVGPFGITMFFNVPLNNVLASTQLSESHQAWPAYQRTWQRWNHIRTYVGIASIVLMALGLVDLRAA